jgi:hypothetical protein
MYILLFEIIKYNIFLKFLNKMIIKYSIIIIQIKLF